MYAARRWFERFHSLAQATRVPRVELCALIDFHPRCKVTYCRRVLRTGNVFFSVRVLRPCVRVHPRLAQVPAMAVTLCGPPSHPRTSCSPLSFCALASTFIHVLRKFRQWLSRLAAPLPTQERFSFRSRFAPLRLRYSASCASSSNGCHVLCREK